MNPEVQGIIHDARGLNSLGVENDDRILSLLRRAHAIEERLSCIRDFHSIVESLTGCSVNGQRRAAILNELRLENKQIIEYQRENLVLKEALEECTQTLDVIMSRHREITSQLNKFRLAEGELFKLVTPATCPKTKQSVNSFKNFTTDMTFAVESGEARVNACNERAAELITENRVLKEVLRTAAIFDRSIIQRARVAIAQLDEKDKEMQDGEKEQNPANQTVIHIEQKKRDGEATLKADQNGHESDEDSDSSNDELNNSIIENDKTESVA